MGRHWLVFNDAQLDTLAEILSQWVSEGFTTPPYRDKIYDIFEMVALNPSDLQYDIRRPIEESDV